MSNKPNLTLVRGDDAPPAAAIRAGIDAVRADARKARDRAEAMIDDVIEHAGASAKLLAHAAIIATDVSVGERLGRLAVALQTELGFVTNYRTGRARP
jgi:hypothetical protein